MIARWKGHVVRSVCPRYSRSKRNSRASDERSRRTNRTTQRSQRLTSSRAPEVKSQDRILVHPLISPMRSPLPPSPSRSSNHSARSSSRTRLSEDWGYLRLEKAVLKSSRAQPQRSSALQTPSTDCSSATLTPAGSKKRRHLSH